MRNIPSDNKGMTLIEIMVALAIAGFATAAIYGAFLSQEKASIGQKHITQVQQNLRAVMNLMANEIRLAGLDMSPGQTSGAGILVAEQGRIRFTCDLYGGTSDGIDNDGDGADNDADEAEFGDGLINPSAQSSNADYKSEEFEYGFAAADDTDNDGIPDAGGAARLRREACGPSGCGGLQPIAENIQAVCFRYSLDGSTWLNSVTGTDLAGIAAVEISILGRTERASGDFNDTKTYTVGSHSITPAGADQKYRHRVLSARIKCRN